MIVLVFDSNGSHAGRLFRKAARENTDGVCAGDWQQVDGCIHNKSDILITGLHPRYPLQYMARYDYDTCEMLMR